MISDYFYTAFNVNRVYKEVGGRSKRDSSPSMVMVELACDLINLVTSVTKWRKTLLPLIVDHAWNIAILAKTYW